MRRTNWPVKDFGIRPAGRPDECFYCNEPKGGTHKPECVIRQRTVVIELKINLVRPVPDNWSPDQIEFNLNDSSYCASNIVSEIVALEDRLQKKGLCMCNVIHTRFLRDATAEDEKEQSVFVAKLPT